MRVVRKSSPKYSVSVPPDQPVKTSKLAKSPTVRQNVPSDPTDMSTEGEVSDQTARMRRLVRMLQCSQVSFSRELRQFITYHFMPWSNQIEYL